MAITCSLNLATYGDLSAPSAYIRVATAETFKSNVQPDPAQPRDERLFVRYSANVYLDAPARATGKSPLDHASGMFEWDDQVQPNILAACYADLKAQETYAAAEDC